MPDRPSHEAGFVAPESGSGEAPARNLSEILEELAMISHAQAGEASAMRGAVSELSRALARLFEMIRADRAGQHTRIAELEEALAQAQARVRELEAGATADTVPGAGDFDALRGAAERLRLRTAQLVQEAGTPADALAREEAEIAEQVRVDAERVAEEARVEAARLAVEASLAEDEALAARRAAEEAANGTPLPVTSARDEPFGRPGILRVFPGAVLPASPPASFDVENELEVDDDRAYEAVAHAVPTISPDRGPGPGPDPSRDADASSVDPSIDRAPSNGSHHATPTMTTVERDADHDDDLSDVAPHGPLIAPPTVVKRPQPITVKPRIARRRRKSLRRRRIDARKLAAVDPASALRAMVSAVDDLWTAGNPLDLVVALTDGGTLHITGGDVVPLTVADVESGTSARSTVTLTSAQLVPLFGRLDLTDEQSAPLIHGSRRDADLLVGWIDRAQRLTAEPL